MDSDTVMLFTSLVTIFYKKKENNNSMPIRHDLPTLSCRESLSTMPPFRLVAGVNEHACGADSIFLIIVMITLKVNSREV